MPFKLAKIGRNRIKSSPSDPTGRLAHDADESGVSADAALARAYFGDEEALPPVLRVSSNTLSELHSSTRATLPSVQRHASSPLSRTLAMADDSPKRARKLSLLLKRARTKAAPVAPLSQSAPASPAPAQRVSAAPPAVERRPVLSLRTRSESLSRFTRRSSSTTSIRPTSPTSPVPDTAEGDFVLRSFRSTTAPAPAPPPITRVQSAMTPTAREPTSPSIKRNSSAVFHETRVASPPSPTIKANKFREAQAARSSASIHSLTSSTSHTHLAELNTSRPSSLLDLPFPPVVADRSREPLTFSPPVIAPMPLARPAPVRAATAAPASLSYGSRPSSPAPSLHQPELASHFGGTESSGTAFVAPKPAFLQSIERRTSLPLGAPFDLPTESTPPASPKLTAPKRTISDSYYVSMAIGMRGKAQRMASSAYAYANERTQAAIQRESDSLDVSATTDSEEDDDDDLSDETSETSHSRADDRHAWGSEAAMKKRAEAHQQAMEASRRLNSSFSTLPLEARAQPVPSSFPAVATLPTSIENSAVQSRPALRSLQVSDEFHVATGRADQISGKRLPASRSATMPLASPLPVLQSTRSAAEPSVSPRPSSPSHMSRAPSRPPTIPRLPMRHASPVSSPAPSSPALYQPHSPMFSGSRERPLRSPIETPRTPPESYDRLTPRTPPKSRPISLPSASSPPPAPPGVDPSVWNALSLQQRLHLQAQGQQYMAMLTREAASGHSDISVSDTLQAPLVSAVEAQRGYFTALDAAANRRASG